MNHIGVEVGRRRATAQGEDFVVMAVLAVIAFAIIWTFVLDPIFTWATRNLVLVLIALVASGGLVAVGWNKYRQIVRHRELVKWKAAREQEIARRREVGQLVIDLEKAIQRFEPSRRYGNEFGYHTELQGWLKSRFSNAKVEIRTGASRPDIVVGDVAIEVKGPTDTNALNTLTTKCLKYSRYYNHLIIVLFEPRFSERNYAEILSGIQTNFPQVSVIRKG